MGFELRNLNVQDSIGKFKFLLTLGILQFLPCKINKTFSALLKMFFRGLPQPLIPSSCISYMDEIKLAEPNQKIVMLRTLLNERIPGTLLVALLNFFYSPVPCKLTVCTPNLR